MPLTNPHGTLRVFSLLLPILAQACAGPSALERDVALARTALAEHERQALSERPALPEGMRPVRDLPGDAAPEYLAALADYRNGLRPSDPEKDITRLELDASRDTIPFAAFANAEPATRILEGSRRERCLLTGFAIPVAPRLADTETLSVDACLKWTWALVERSRALEETGQVAAAERVLLGALSFGMHLEEDAAVANAMTGRSVQAEVAFYLARFYRRTGRAERWEQARALGDDLERFGKPWTLVPFLSTLCLDAAGALEAARWAGKAGRLPLACETAAAVAFSYFRNGAERERGPSPTRYEALETLRKSFPDPVLLAIAERAEAMLAWRRERIEAFLEECMQGAEKYE
jgi:hypothetical protein